MGGVDRVECEEDVCDKDECCIEGNKLFGFLAERSNQASGGRGNWNRDDWPYAHHIVFQP